MMVLALKQSEC